MEDEKQTELFKEEKDTTSNVEVSVVREEDLGDVMVACVDFLLKNMRGHDFALKEAGLLRGKLKSFYEKER
jgi:hypothetical protein